MSFLSPRALAPGLTSIWSFDRNFGLHVMTRHVAQVGEGSSTCRCESKFSQALRWDNHPLESVWAELWKPVAAHVEVGAEEELLGCYSMEFRIMVKEP